MVYKGRRVPMIGLAAPREPVITVGSPPQGKGHSDVMNGSVHIGVRTKPLEVDCELGLGGNK